MRFKVSHMNDPLQHLWTVFHYFQLRTHCVYCARAGFVSLFITFGYHRLNQENRYHKNIYSHSKQI